MMIVCTCTFKGLYIVTLDEMIRHALISLKGCVQGDSVSISIIDIYSYEE